MVLNIALTDLFSNSRPGRPPKRGLPFPAMSPQDAMLHFKVDDKMVE